MQIIKGIAIAAVLIIAGLLALIVAAYLAFRIAAAIFEQQESWKDSGSRSEETITLLAIENSKPHKDGLLFRICQYVEFKQRARRENEKL